VFLKHPDKSSGDIRKTQMGFGALTLSLSKKTEKAPQMRRQAPQTRPRESEGGRVCYFILFCFVLFYFVLFFQIIIVITVMNYRSGNSQVVSNNHKIKYNLRRPENSQVFFWQEQK